MEPFLAQIILFGGNFAPRGWAFCNGQLLAISQNSALFSLLGTIYGGDGRTTFALPDLRGRSPIHFGAGPGLAPRQLGQRGGSETTFLSVENLPNHTHQIQVSNQGNVSLPVNTLTGDNDETNPGAGYLSNTGDDLYASSPTSNATYGGSTLPVNGAQMNILPTGGSQPVNSMPPYIAMNYIIALQGIFPSRS